MKAKQSNKSRRNSSKRSKPAKHRAYVQVKPLFLSSAGSEKRFEELGDGFDQACKLCGVPENKKDKFRVVLGDFFDSYGAESEIDFGVPAQVAHDIEILRTRVLAVCDQISCASPQVKHVMYGIHFGKTTTEFLRLGDELSALCDSHVRKIRKATTRGRKRNEWLDNATHALLNIWETWSRERAAHNPEKAKGRSGAYEYVSESSAFVYLILKVTRPDLEVTDQEIGTYLRHTARDRKISRTKSSNAEN